MGKIISKSLTFLFVVSLTAFSFSRGFSQLKQLPLLLPQEIEEATSNLGVVTDSELQNLRERIEKIEEHLQEHNGRLAAKEDTFASTKESTTSRERNREVDINPDVFEPSWTLQDYANLPQHTRPRHVWLRNCVRSLANDTEIVKPFRPGIRLYALGDCIRRCVKCGCGGNQSLKCTDETEKIYSGTMAASYQRLSCPETNNYSAIYEIFADFSGRKGFHKPDPEAVVIHLRLGDVIEYSSTSAESFLISGGVGNHPNSKKKNQHKRPLKTVRGFDEYLDLINSANASKVVIIGGSHKPLLYQKSRVYANCLSRGLAKAGKQVEMYLDNGDADQDFFFLSNAKKVIVSTGGYSNLIGNLTERYGGHVLGGVFY